MWIVLLIVYVIVLLFTLGLYRMAKSDDEHDYNLKNLTSELSPFFR